MEKNKSILILSLSAITCLIIGQLYFPFVLLIGIAPILALAKVNDLFRIKHFDFLILGILLLTQLVIALFKSESIIFAGCYAILIWATFVLFSFTDKYAKNKLGVFTIIVYWLAAEYLALLALPASSHFLLGAGFDGTNSINWSGYTGLTGVSTWILFANALFYYTLFYGENNIFTGSFRPISLTYSILGAAMPLIIISFFDYESSKVTATIVEQFYEGETVAIKPYAVDGEVFARSIGWVTAFIAVYAIVKRKVK